MNENDIKVLLDFQHFAANKRLETLIRSAHESDNEEDDRISIMTDSQAEMLAAAGTETDKDHPKDRKSLIQSLGGLMVILSLCLFMACSNGVSETKYIDQTAIKTTEYTGANATEVAYYAQLYFTDKFGDKYVEEKAEDYVYVGSEKKVVPAGTKISTIGNIKVLPEPQAKNINYDCYEQYGFTQTGKTINLFYKAKTVTYRFFLMPNDTVPVAILQGKTQLPLTPPPTKNYDASGKFAIWKGTDGTILQRTYGTKDLDFFAQWFTPYGKKERPDTVGDIVFSDGTASHYSGLTLSDEQKKNAIAVIVSTSYNRTTGNGTGYNEGRVILGLGTIASPALQWWTRGNSFDTPTSKNDGRMNTSIIRTKSTSESFDDFPALKWAINYATYASEEKGINISDELKTGWYLPAYNEWLQALISRDASLGAFNALGITYSVLDDNFWTSTSTMGKKTDSDPVSWYIHLTQNALLEPGQTCTALAMREFK